MGNETGITHLIKMNGEDIAPPPLCLEFPLLLASQIRENVQNHGREIGCGRHFG